MARNFAADQPHHRFWYRESAHPKDVPSALVDTGVDRRPQPRDMAKGHVNLKQFVEAILRREALVIGLSCCNLAIPAKQFNRKLLQF